MSHKYFLSIVLFTHNRVDRFKEALNSLKNQSVNREEFELVVVDNDKQPTEAVRQLTEDAESIITARYIFEPNLGVSNARNAGGKAAYGEYVSYFDDDAKAPDNYVRRILDIIRDIKPDIFGGPIYPFYLSNKPPWYKDIYGTHCFLGNEPKYLRQNEYISGANFIIRKEILDKVGWFNPVLSKVGKKKWYGSETQIQIDAWKDNPSLTAYYDPSLYVYHLVMHDKMSIRWQLTNSYNLGRSLTYLWIPQEQIYLARKKSPRIFFIALTKLLFDASVGIFIRDRKKYNNWKNYVYEVVGRRLQIFGHYQRLVVDSLKSISS